MPERKAHRFRAAAIAGALLFLPAASVGIVFWGSRMQGLHAAVKAEEPVYTIVNPDNGSGPLWSHGCTSIVRSHGEIVVSQMETGENVPPLCNTRWRLLRRTHAGWQAFAEADGYRQREPCPLAVVSDGAIFLNVNDSTAPPGTEYGPCEPYLLRFAHPAAGEAPAKIMPSWAGEPYFTDHSYRGYCAGAARGELLMLNIDARTSEQHWCLLDALGATLAAGSLTFPIRACYPQAALRERAGYVLAVGDVQEPVDEWREYKFEQTERKWDYVFRILYFAWSPDLTAQGFAGPIEVANVDATAGHISNQDLWIGPSGAAYVLYTEREVQSALMRDRFFPGRPIEDALYLAVVEEGRVISREVLIGAGEQPGCARFHEGPDGELYVAAYLATPEPHNELIRVLPKAGKGPGRVKIPFRHPFSSFTVASVRAGNSPSRVLDVLGHNVDGSTLCYGQVRIR